MLRENFHVLSSLYWHSFLFYHLWKLTCDQIITPLVAEIYGTVYFCNARKTQSNLAEARGERMVINLYINGSCRLEVIYNPLICQIKKWRFREWESLPITKFMGEPRLKPRSSEQSSVYHITIVSWPPSGIHQKLQEEGK